MSSVVGSSGETLLISRPARLKTQEFGCGVLGAGAAELDYAPAQEISERLRKIVDSGELGYALPSDLVDLKQSTSAWHERSMGWSPRPENFVATPDITSAFSYFLLTLAPLDGPVLVPSPGYSKLKQVALELGFEVLNYTVQRSSNGYAYSLDQISEHLRTSRRGVLVLLHPHNPTGYLAQKAELEMIARIVDEFGAIVFSDEIHGPLWLEDEPHLPYAASSDIAREHTVTAVSSSKAWGLSGARVTQLAFPSGEMARRVQAGRQQAFIEGAVGALGVQASIAAYDRGGDWLEALRSRLRSNREVVTKFAAESPIICNYIQPQSSFLAWMELKMDAKSESAAQLLRDRSRLGVLGAEEFDWPQASYFRLNFGSPPVMVEQCLSLISSAAATNEDARLKGRNSPSRALKIKGSTYVKQK